MPLDRLQRLLEQADRAAGPPPRMPKDLPQRVLRRSAQRPGLPVAKLGSAAAAIILAFGIMTLVRDIQSGPIRGAGGLRMTVGVEGPSVGVDRLQRDADSRLTVARRTRALCERAARLAALKAEAERPDPVLRVRAEVDQAATVLVQQGDHLYRELGLKESAADSYREAVRLFPRTPSAALARQRLADLGMHEGDTL